MQGNTIYLEQYHRNYRYMDHRHPAKITDTIIAGYQVKNIMHSNYW